MHRNTKQPRLISTASVVIDLPLNLKNLPAKGAGVIAKSSSTVIGGGIVILSAVSRQNIPACLASPLGTGPNAAQIREAFRNEKICCLVEELVGDNGMNINLLDENGNYTSIISVGVEAEPQLLDLKAIRLKPKDHIYLAGVDLVSDSSVDVLVTWCTQLPEENKLVFAPGPFIAEIRTEVLKQIMPRVNVLTLNERQLRWLCSNSDLGLSESDFWDTIYDYVPQDCIVIKRDGSNDCLYKTAKDQPVRSVECIKDKIVNSTGVADTHTGVFIASVMNNIDVEQALFRANVAAFICGSHHGGLNCPTAEEIDDFIARYKAKETVNK